MAAPSAGAAETRCASVLVVDDHPVVRHGLVQLFSKQPDLAVCGESDTPADAMRMYEQTQPDIVIVDISLRDGNGLEFLKDLKTRHPEARILVSSIHDDNLYAERVLQAGGMGYINKQEPTTEMIEAVRQVLAGQVYLSRVMTERLLSRAMGGQTVERSPIGTLSDRELEVFELLGQGLTSAQIAEKLNVKQKTVETYREKIKRKLNLENGNQLIQHAVQWVLEES